MTGQNIYVWCVQWDFTEEAIWPSFPFFFFLRWLIWQVWCFLKVKLRRQRHLEESQSTPKQEYIFLNIVSFRIFQILRTLPLSRSSWHLLRQSGLLVNSTKAFSAWSRVVVSVVSYSCLHRFSNWARLWKRWVKEVISTAYYISKKPCLKLLDKKK